MNDKILYELFYGNVNEQDKRTQFTPEQKKSIDKECELHQKLCNQLNDEQKKLFNEFLETSDNNRCDELAFHFVNGVKLGLKIGLGLLDEDKQTGKNTFCISIREK